jgi:hypothetical protein
MRVIEGTLKFIDEYKRFFLEVTEETYSKLEKIEFNGDKKCWYKKDNVCFVRLNLLKYNKTNKHMVKYEKLIGSNLRMEVRTNNYNSTRFGSGISFSVLDISKLTDGV